MLFLLTFISLGFLLFYIYYVLSRTKKLKSLTVKYPPLEKGLPFIGILRQVEHPLHNYFVKLGKKYGHVYRIKFGMREILILNNYESIRKAFKDDGYNFSGRFSDKNFLHDSGIIFKDGDVWDMQRSLIMKSLRDFGMGKSKSFDIIEDECLILLDELLQSNDEPVDISELISSHTVNIIAKFIMNKRFDRGNPNLCLIENLIHETQHSKDATHLLFMLFPALGQSEIASKIAHKLSPHAKIFEKIHQFFKSEIDQHTEVLDFDSDGEDFMDKFLIKRRRLEETNMSLENFTDLNLVRISFELFIAGYETTSATLEWSFVFMARYTAIQNKVYEEIIEHIGLDRSPTMDDKKYLHYTQAVMDEILRLSSVAPLAIAHRTLNNTVLDDYFIPKNTMVFPNLFACHTDVSVWDKPHDFNPEHFLIQDDQGHLKYNAREELIPFGIGKRQCLGESLARMEYFVFFVNVMRRFSVKFAEEITDSKYQEVLRCNRGSLRTSSIKSFIFERR